MRNLKRALSLALASVMLLGMMVVGTSAASYPDVKDSDNVEAIEVLNAVGVMIGDRGNFRPDAAVNRHEMAAIMARLILGKDAENYVGNHPFTDVYPWADKYVAACYENGIINGTSKTTFSGNQPLTAIQAATMMLRALGYEHLTKGASDWRVPVASQANKIGLFRGVTSSPSAQLTRNQVAQLALNTLESDMVEFTGELGWEVNGISIGTQLKWDGIKDLNNVSNGGYNYTNDPTGPNDPTTHQKEYLQLCEDLYDGKLKKNTRDTDDFGRKATTWSYDGDDIITLADSATRTYTEEVEYQDIYKDLGLTGGGKAATVYTNGADNDEDITLTRNDDTALGGNGVLVQVYKDGDDIDIVVIDTYLAQVSGDYDEDDEELTIAAVTSGSAPITSSNDTLSSDDFANLASFEDEDYVLITMANDEVKTIVAAETVTAPVTGYRNKSNGNPDTVTFDGSAKKYSENFELNGQTTTYKIDEDSVFIMDAYGYVIGLDDVAGSDDYVYVDDFDTQGNFRNAKDTADAYFPDGTNKTIVLKNAYKANGSTKLDETNNVIDQDQAGWYTYTVKDNEYTITAVSDSLVKGDVTGNVGASAGQTGAAKVITENGKVSIVTSGSPVRGNNKTVFVVLDDDDKITVYEGIKNVPDISVNGALYDNSAYTVGVAVSVKDNYANYVFIDASDDGAAHIKGTSSSASDLIYILNDGKPGRDSKDNSIVTYDAIVNGTKTTVTANANGILDSLGLYEDIRYDSDGYVDDANYIDDASDENYKYYDFSAAAFNKVTYKDGVLAVTNTNPASSVDFIMADSFTIYTVDGTTVKTVTADKLAKDYDDGFNDASVRGKVWAVLNDDDEVTALYVDIKGTSAGSKATYVSTAFTTAVTSKTAASKVVVTVGGKAYDVAKTEDTAAKQAAAWVTAWNADSSSHSGWTAKVDGSNIVIEGTTTSGQSNPITGGNFTDGDDGTGKANVTIAWPTTASTTDSSTKDMFEVTIDGKKYAVADTNTTAANQVSAWVAAYNADTNNTVYDAAVENTNQVKLTAKANGAQPSNNTGMTGGTWTNGTNAVS